MRKCNIMFGDQRYYGEVPPHITLAVELIDEIVVLYGPPRRVLDKTNRSEGLVVFDATILTLTEFLDATCAKYTQAHEKLIYKHEAVIAANKELIRSNRTTTDGLSESLQLNNTLTKERDEAINNRDTLLERANSADAKVEALQREVMLARSQYEFAAARTGDQATTIAKLQDELSSMTSDLGRAKSSVATLISSGEFMRTEHNNLSVKYIQLVRDHESLERKYTMMTALQQKTHADNVQLRRDHDHEESCYRRLLEDNLNLRNQLNSAVECVIDSV